MKLNRDPVWYTNLFAVIIMAVAAFGLPLTLGQQGALNGLVLAIAAIVQAVKVGEGQLALAVGLFQALIALALAFGLHLSPEQQFVIMSLVTAIASGFLRTQVVAPVPAEPADAAALKRR